MGAIWCEIEEQKVLRGKCLYDKGGTQPNNRTCPECSYFKSLFPTDNISLKKAIKRPIANKNPSKKPPVQALLKDSGSWFDRSIPYFLKALQDQYEEDYDPIPLMDAFITAVKYKRSIPTWIIKKINEVFRKYLYDEYKHEGDRSLDILMGCKGAGKDRAKERLALRRREVRLMTDMGRLIQQGMKITDAAEVVSRFNPISSPKSEDKRKLLSPEKIRQMYHVQGKVWEIKKIVHYNNPKRTKALLKFTPQALREKYPNIKTLQKKYPHLFGKIN